MKVRTESGTPPPEDACVTVPALVMPTVQQVATGFENLNMAYDFPPGFKWPLAARVRQARLDNRKRLEAGECLSVRIAPGEVLQVSAEGWRVVKK